MTEPGPGGGAVIRPVDPGSPDDEVREFNTAFDKFVAAGQAPWLAQRTGPGVDAVGNADLPAGAPALPRLDATFIPGLLGGQDAATSWYIPEFPLLDGDDPAFRFAVTQKAGEVTPQGRPVNQATMTLSLQAVLPDSVAVLTPDPGTVFLPAVDLRPVVNLSVPVTDADGVIRPRTVPGTVTNPAHDRYEVTFQLPQGVVEAAYEHLTDLGGAGLEVAAAYSGLLLVRGFQPDVGFPHGPTFDGWQFTTYGDGQHGALVPLNELGWFRFAQVTALFPVTPPHRSLPLGSVYRADNYRSRFTITMRDGVTRPIIDVSDLTDFAAARSEYRELTSLGDVKSRFPTVRRVYFGQISGTVVALPAAYAIIHGADGVDAACDALVDPSSDLTGSRFHFTFTLAPDIDPIDLAGLDAALPALPEAAGRTLRLTLPDGLDPRNPSTLNGFPAATVTFGDDVAPHAVQVSVDIADDDTTPALTGVNQFLAELCAGGPPPLSAALAVRLDDHFPQPVTTAGPLNLHRTAESDDLDVTIVAGSAPAVTNRGPLDLVLHRAATLPPLTVTSLGEQILGPGRTVALPVPATATTVRVARSLVVPTPIPKELVRKLVTFRTQTVQQVQHPLTVHAAFDFTAEGVTALTIAFRLTAAADLPIPDLTLTAGHPIDFVHVLVPVDSAVTGLDTVVALTLTGPGGTRTVSLHHDFVDDPILTVTGTTISGATP